jgi:hypothetical protein
MPSSWARRELGHEDDTAFWEAWAIPRPILAYELFASSFFRYCGLFLSSLAGLPDHSNDRIRALRMGITASPNSSNCARRDLYLHECMLHVCTLAHILCLIENRNDKSK